MMQARKRAAALLAILFGAASLALGVGGCGGDDRDGDARDSAAAGSARAGDDTGGRIYVDEASCAGCHPSETERWAGSHHDLAMQPATDETMLGEFGTSFTHKGETTTFLRDGDAFRVRTRGPSGEDEEFDVPYVFGVEPLQQLLLELPGGRLQALSVAWDTERGEWYHLYPDEDVAIDDPLHWTGRYQNWNAMCAECHSTNLVKDYDASTETYDTRWDLVNVSCQACHGPASEHLEWARGATPGGDGRYAEDALAKGFVVDFKGQDAAYQVDQCARCHARRHRVAPGHVAGRSFLDEYRPELLRDGLYHADGQILDEVYVYGSFVQSKMYMRGVRCTDCHDPHSLDLWVEGDATCMQCHSEQAPLERFPTLQAKKYDTPEHHHHPVDSEGARCVACHMPAKNYMVVDPRRDHSFRIPRPDLTLTAGTPNACNGCHTDQSPAWAAEAMSGWLEEPLPMHYGAVLAYGRTGGPGAIEALTQLGLDPESPPIVRATAFELLANYGNLGLPALAAGLRDEDPLIRATAVEGLEVAPAEALPELLGPLLGDDVRAVRTAAARALASVPADRLGDRLPAFEAALAEYEAAQDEDADMPAAHLNLGVLRTRQGRRGDAERAYRTALELDPFFLPARFNLANLLNGTGQNPAAEAVLRDGIAHVPEGSVEQGELYYSLGLLLAEMNKLEQSVEALAGAARTMPLRPRVRYNLALARLQTGDDLGGVADLMEASRLAPHEPEYVHTLAQHFAQRKEWARALTYAQKLVELVPDAPGPKQLLQQVQLELARESGG